MKLITIPFENIIYDEPAAIAEVAQKKQEAANHNRKATIHNHVWTLIFTACAAAIAVGARSVLPNDVHPFAGWVMTFVTFGLFGMGLMALFVSFIRKETTTEYDLCSANARYYYFLYAFGCSPMKVELTSDKDRLYRMRVTMEDAHHVVYTEEIPECYIRKWSKTDIQEPVLDLKEGVYYIPYVDATENETSF